MNTYEKLGRHAQVSLLIGDHVGEFGTLVESYLPKPAIDRATFRMAELLKARFGTRSPEANRPETSPVENAEGNPPEVELDLEGL